MDRQNKYAGSSLSGNLLETLIHSAHLLQGMAKTINPDENSRTGFISLMLNVHGFIAKDQAHWGISGTGKSIGEVDIKVDTPKRETEAIIEAFNLKYLDRTVINEHLKKCFGYDPNGLDRNFILVYAESHDFLRLWRKYLAHLRTIEYPYELVEVTEEPVSRYSEIKVARARHLRQGQTTDLFHIFINLYNRTNPGE